MLSDASGDAASFIGSHEDGEMQPARAVSLAGLSDATNSTMPNRGDLLSETDCGRTQRNKSAAQEQQRPVLPLVVQVGNVFDSLCQNRLGVHQRNVRRQLKRQRGISCVIFVDPRGHRYLVVNMLGYLFNSTGKSHESLGANSTGTCAMLAF